MCGIIGVIGQQAAQPLLLETLKRLEYRGYDSAGIATLHEGSIVRERAEGKLNNLETKLSESPLNGTTGIGHTRWATHGIPNETNAHPHATDKVAVVHNGIIENYAELREELIAKGQNFQSQTDSEVIPQLLTLLLESGLSPEDAMKACLDRLEGAFALAILLADYPDFILCARKGSPLAIGIGEEEMFVGSDAIALAPLTNTICYLEDGDWALIRRDGFEIFDVNHAPVERNIKVTALTGAAIGKGNFRHYMHKEIYEQPTVIGQTYNVYYNPEQGHMVMPELPFDLVDIERISIVACGTSYYAGCVARYWIESIAKIPVDIDIASEFRYREPLLPKNTAAIFISQSGETADTLAAMNYVKDAGHRTLAVVNVTESSMANLADAVLPTYAGPEIGVASTKAFTTQLTTLACFTLALAKAKNAIKEAHYQRLCHTISEIPSKISEILHHEDHIKQTATKLIHVRDMLFIGRGTGYAIAYEAALKMKEISYIHAEAYPAGEMKHGPIALIDEDVPVIAIAPTDALFDKMASNIQEAAARSAPIFVISDKNGASLLSNVAAETIIMPEVDPFVAPILYAIPAQLLAYHVAVQKGTDVDQPRNLAKSVTVE